MNAPQMQQGSTQGLREGWSTVPARVPARPAVMPVRLTRRGRAIVLLTLVTLLLAAFSLGRVGSQAAPRGTQLDTVSHAQTVVQPGESLWAIAKRIAPGTDPRSTIYRLQQLNDLDGGSVRAGQLLLLPR